MHTIYVAGPVLRPDSFQQSPELVDLYKRLAAAAEDAKVGLTLPLYDEELDKLPPAEFTAAIWSLIKRADSLVALLDAPGARPGTNLAVAGEAHFAAVARKQIAIVAVDTHNVPRMLAGLSQFGVWRASDVSFPRLFHDMKRASEDSGPAPSTPVAMA